jgi:8-amino-7-oxononanoate synthase
LTSDPYQWFSESLHSIRRADWYRAVLPIQSPSGPVIEVEGQALVNFASNDYLGLSQHPRLKAAAIAAIERWGTGSTGSRLLSGHCPLHSQLETEIARWKGTEAAMVFSSGYLANVGTILALVGARDLIVADEYNHSSLKRGAQLSGASVYSYNHGSTAHLEHPLKEHRHQYRRCLILTDGVFSMDGDLCPLPAIGKLAQNYQAMLLVDEAHASGIFGPTGAGCGEHFAALGCSTFDFIQVGTLSKALGSLGGYVAGRADWIDFLRNRAATWIYSTALSPAQTATAIAALEVIRAEPQLRHQLWHNREEVREILGNLDLALLPSHSPILCIEVANPKVALELSAHLRRQGILAPAIRPPTVPTSRLRFSVMASHQPQHLQLLRQALSGV